MSKPESQDQSTDILYRLGSQSLEELGAPRQECVLGAIDGREQAARAEVGSLNPSRAKPMTCEVDNCHYIDGA